VTCGWLADRELVDEYLRECEQWRENYTVCRTSESFCYITVRGEGKMESARGEQDVLCAVASPPSHTSAGWTPVSVFVTVNDVRRYLMASILLFHNFVSDSCAFL
jgi:hypothetical protein